MEDLMITTMPIKPYKNINVGLMIAPTLCDVFGSILKCKKVLTFNLMHSYDEKQENLKKYTDSIEKFKIKYNEIIKDVDFVNEYLKRVEQLYKKGTIIIKNGPIIRCDCGRVEMSKSALNNYSNGDLYYWKNNKIMCKLCRKECKEYSQKSLYLEIKKEFCNDISITPNFSKKVVNDLTNKFLNQMLLISKNRQNDYNIRIEGEKYNIDIDMLWIMFNQLEISKNQILIASNHQIYEMFISNYINNIFGNKKIHYMATPYLINNDNVNLQDKILSKESAYYKKLAILYNLKWKYQTSNWNNGILAILNKLNEEELEELYNSIINITSFDHENIEKVINNILFNINLTKNMKVLKR